MLEITNLFYQFGKKEILKGITTRFKPGMLHVIVGPNGCGKSTLMKVFSGESVAGKGLVKYFGKDIATYEKSALAKSRAVMSQQPELYFPLTVAEIVMMGRYPHFNLKPTSEDEAICHQAMEKMELLAFAERDYLTLSGGEKQRVHFARILCQIWGAYEGECKGLFLDEAVSHLDLKHQHQLLQEAKKLSGLGSLVICILHDLNLAITYADRILMMKEGRIRQELDDPYTINPGMVREIFEVDAQIVKRQSNRPVIIFEPGNFTVY
ncbi:MAG: heme ABC transporter ATP-binding protein [Terrimonas sp.]|nr:heme ABC transporter ATP-binding protein [Terrimonas sp.]